MVEKAHASTVTPYEVQKNDAALDFQEFTCQQVGTNAKFGFVLAMLYFCYPVYQSVGLHHTSDDFITAFDTTRVRLNHQQKVDLRDSRFGIGQVITDYDGVLRAKGTREHLLQDDICQRFSTPYAHWQNPAENYMRKSKDGMLALLNNAGLPDSLQEVCFRHSTYSQGLLMPRKRYDVKHKPIIPQEAFTGIKPSYKRINGMVIGMRCWWYNCKELRNAMTKHDGDRWWCGFDDEIPGGHVIWEPHTHSLVRRVHVNNDPTTLYRDLMGPLCEIRARICFGQQGATLKRIFEMSWRQFGVQNSCNANIGLHIEMCCDKANRAPMLLKRRWRWGVCIW
jgi:hypothetical protein